MTQRNSPGRRQYAPAKPRHSRRGEVGQSWRTKAWTRSRVVDFLQWKASRG